MNHPQRIQRRRAKGWRAPGGAVYVGRGSAFGNPFVVGRDGTQAECVDLYRLLLAGFLNLSSTSTPDEQLAAHAAVREGITGLKGKDLMCWCPPSKPCHADILLALANGRRLPPSKVKLQRLG